MIEQAKCWAWLLALSAASMGVLGEEGGDVGFVTKTDVLPNGVVKSQGELARVKPLLAALPDGHRLRLEFETVSKSVTGYPDDVRFVRLATPLGPKDKPDGQEVEYLDWHRKPIRTTDYRNGVKHGVERHFEADRGALQSETLWENGEIHGLKRVFHPNGKVASESTYVKGMITGQSRSYNEAGGLIRVVTYEKGKRNGEQIDYWPDKPDVAQRIIPYQNDQVVGVAKGFYLNGKLKWERPYKDNRQHGVENQYAADGVLEKTLYWLDGNPVSEEDYRAKEKK